MSNKHPISAFLIKTYKMVEDESTKGIIRWAPDGKSFVVHDKAQLANEILPTYFNHKKFFSFVRQLNLYGFHKRTQRSNGSVTFSHPKFVRGKKNLLREIRRKKANSGKPSTKEAVMKLQSDVSELRDSYDRLHHVQEKILFVLSRLMRGGPHGIERGGKKRPRSIFAAESAHHAQQQHSARRNRRHPSAVQARSQNGQLLLQDGSGSQDMFGSAFPGEYKSSAPATASSGRAAASSSSYFGNSKIVEIDDDEGFDDEDEDMEGDLDDAKEKSGTLESKSTAQDEDWTVEEADRLATIVDAMPRANETPLGKFLDDVGDRDGSQLVAGLSHLEDQYGSTAATSSSANNFLASPSFPALSAGRTASASSAGPTPFLLPNTSTSTGTATGTATANNLDLFDSGFVPRPLKRARLAIEEEQPSTLPSSGILSPNPPPLSNTATLELLEDSPVPPPVPPIIAQMPSPTSAPSQPPHITDIASPTAFFQP